MPTDPIEQDVVNLIAHDPRLATLCAAPPRAVLMPFMRSSTDRYIAVNLFLKPHAVALSNLWDACVTAIRVPYAHSILEDLKGVEIIPCSWVLGPRRHAGPDPPALRAARVDRGALWAGTARPAPAESDRRRDLRLVLGPWLDRRRSPTGSCRSRSGTRDRHADRGASGRPPRIGGRRACLNGQPLFQPVRGRRRRHPRAGGLAVQEELWAALRSSGKPFAEPGTVVRTNPGPLKTRHLLHAVAVDAFYGSSIEIVERCLRSALDMASRLGASTVGVPALATGYGPLSIREFAEALRRVVGRGDHSVQRLIVVLRQAEDVDLVRRILANAGPVVPGS